MRRICRNCSKEFETGRSKMRPGTGLLCSNSCKYIENAKRWVGNKDWEKTKSTQFKKGHPTYNQPKSLSFGKILYMRWRNEIMKRYDSICQSCGLKAQVVHHPKSRKEYPELIVHPDNGIALCRSCHIKIHPPKK